VLALTDEGLRKRLRETARGFVMSRSLELLRRITAQLLPGADPSEVMLRIETRDELGRTDLELQAGSRLLLGDPTLEAALKSGDELTRSLSRSDA